MLSNHALYLRTAVQYVLLFLLLTVNSEQSQNLMELHALTLATHSYVLLLCIIFPTTPHRSLLILYDSNCIYLWLTLVINYYFLKCILGRIAGDVWYRNTP